MKVRSIDRALKRMRERGLNQSQFATLIDVDPQTITNWKSRGLPPEHNSLVADALEWSIDELLGRPNQNPSEIEWPFAEVDIRRIGRLTKGELLQLQGIIVDKLAEFDLERQSRNTVKNKSDLTLRTILGSAKTK